MNTLVQELQKNLVFVLQFLGVVLALFVVAYASEKVYNKRTGYTGRILTTKKIAIVGLFSAISTVLMFFEFTVPFAPPFYKLDFSEVPVLIVTFIMGPVAGLLTEFCKILLKLVTRSTTTAFVGELANFSVGASFILPAGILYLYNRNKKFAIIGCMLGTIVMTVFGSAFNGIYLLPKFAMMAGMDIEKIIGMGDGNQPFDPVRHDLCAALCRSP